MKIWLGKLLVSFLWEKYLIFEKEWIVEKLADLETAWLEETIPSSTETEPAVEQDEEEAEEDEDEHNDELELEEDSS